MLLLSLRHNNVAISTELMLLMLLLLLLMLQNDNATNETFSAFNFYDERFFVCFAPTFFCLVAADTIPFVWIMWRYNTCTELHWLQQGALIMQKANNNTVDSLVHFWRQCNNFGCTAVLMSKRLCKWWSRRWCCSKPMNKQKVLFVLLFHTIT